MSTLDNFHETNQPPPSMALMHLFHGARITQLLYVAAKLGIADLLYEGAKSSAELAQAVGAAGDDLYPAGAIDNQRSSPCADLIAWLSPFFLAGPGVEGNDK